MELEEFKLKFEKEFHAVSNHLSEELRARFQELSSKVGAYLKRMQLLKNKEQLKELRDEVGRDCPLLDFGQTLIDIDAQIALGKRPISALFNESASSSSSSFSDEKPKAKRRKVQNAESSSSEDESESSSSGSSSSGDSSSSGSGSSSSDSSSENDDGSSSEESKG